MPHLWTLYEQISGEKNPVKVFLLKKKNLEVLAAKASSKKFIKNSLWGKWRNICVEELLQLQEFFRRDTEESLGFTVGLIEKNLKKIQVYA